MSWAQIRGHDQLARDFRDLLARGRLGQAYIFLGPAGVGKRLFAKQLAKSLFCDHPPRPFDSCDRCPSCQQVDHDSHPNFIVSRRPWDKTVFMIDTAQNFIADLAFKAARGGWKFGLIDDADDFNDESANCLLKTLEEPWPKTCLILLATDHERQFPTIRSRCQTVRFTPLAPDLIQEWLTTQGIAADDARRLARLAHGSLGLARDLADPAISGFRRDLSRALSTPSPDAVSLAKFWGKFVDDAGKEAVLRRHRMSLSIRLLLDLLVHALRRSLGAEADDPDADAAIPALAQRWDAEKLMRLIDRTIDAEMHNERLVPLALIVESLADALA